MHYWYSRTVVYITEQVVKFMVKISSNYSREGCIVLNRNTIVGSLNTIFSSADAVVGYLAHPKTMSAWADIKSQRFVEAVISGNKSFTSKELFRYGTHLAMYIIVTYGMASSSGVLQA